MRARTSVTAAGIGLLMVGALGTAPAGAADGVQPTYASADVDGSTAEWTGDDVFGPLVGNDPPFEVRGQVSARYDCEAGVLYILAQAAPDVVFQTIDPDEAYVRLGPSGKLVSGTSGDDGVAPDFAWVGLDGDSASGFEASAPVEEGDYPASLRVHAKVPDDSGDGYETIDLSPRYSDLVLDCEVEVEPEEETPPPETPPETPPEEPPPPEQPPAVDPEPEVPVVAPEAATPPPEEVSTPPAEADPLPEVEVSPKVLARTGSSDAPLAAFGLGLVLLGLALRLFTRRRPGLEG